MEMQPNLPSYAKTLLRQCDAGDVQLVAPTNNERVARRAAGAARDALPLALRHTVEIRTDRDGTQFSAVVDSAKFKTACQTYVQTLEQNAQEMQSKAGKSAASRRTMANIAKASRGEQTQQTARELARMSGALDKLELTMGRPINPYIRNFEHLTDAEILVFVPQAIQHQLSRVDILAQNLDLGQAHLLLDSPDRDDATVELASVIKVLRREIQNLPEDYKKKLLADLESVGDDLLNLATYLPDPSEPPALTEETEAPPPAAEEPAAEEAEAPAEPEQVAEPQAPAEQPPAAAAAPAPAVPRPVRDDQALQQLLGRFDSAMDRLMNESYTTMPGPEIGKALGIATSTLLALTEEMPRLSLTQRLQIAERVSSLSDLQQNFWSGVQQMALFKGRLLPTWTAFARRLATVSSTPEVVHSDFTAAYGSKDRTLAKRYVKLQNVMLNVVAGSPLQNLQPSEMTLARVEQRILRGETDKLYMEDRTTVLTNAALSGRIDTVKALISAGIPVSSLVASTATIARTSSIKMVLFLMDQGLDFEPVRGSNKKSEDPLKAAFFNGPVCALLLSKRKKLTALEVKEIAKTYLPSNIQGDYYSENRAQFQALLDRFISEGGSFKDLEGDDEFLSRFFNYATVEQIERFVETTKKEVNPRVILKVTYDSYIPARRDSAKAKLLVVMPLFRGNCPPDQILNLAENWLPRVDPDMAAKILKKLTSGLSEDNLAVLRDGFLSLMRTGAIKYPIAQALFPYLGTFSEEEVASNPWLKTMGRVLESERRPPYHVASEIFPDDFHFSVGHYDMGSGTGVSSNRLLMERAKLLLTAKELGIPVSGNFSFDDVVLDRDAVQLLADHVSGKRAISLDPSRPQDIDMYRKLVNAARYLDHPALPVEKAKEPNGFIKVGEYQFKTPLPPAGVTDLSTITLDKSEVTLQIGDETLATSSLILRGRSQLMREASPLPDHIQLDVFLNTLLPKSQRGIVTVPLAQHLLSFYETGTVPMGLTSQELHKLYNICTALQTDKPMLARLGSALIDSLYQGLETPGEHAVAATELLQSLERHSIPLERLNFQNIEKRPEILEVIDPTYLPLIVFPQDSTIATLQQAAIRLNAFFR